MSMLDHDASRHDFDMGRKFRRRFGNPIGFTRVQKRIQRRQSRKAGERVIRRELEVFGLLDLPQYPRSNELYNLIWDGAIDEDSSSGRVTQFILLLIQAEREASPIRR